MFGDIRGPQRPRQGVEMSFKNNEIDELAKQDVSLMPADLQKALSVEELVDLIEYLTTLKKAM